MVYAYKKNVGYIDHQLVLVFSYSKGNNFNTKYPFHLKIKLHHLNLQRTVKEASPPSKVIFVSFLISYLSYSP